jgi:hypothetical protein
VLGSKKLGISCKRVCLPFYIRCLNCELYSGKQFLLGATFWFLNNRPTISAKMDVQPRVWPPTEIALSGSHHHHHDQQLQQPLPNQPQNDTLYSPPDMANERQNKRQRLFEEHDDRYPHNPAHVPVASSSTLPHHQGPQGNPYPPPSDEPHPEPGVMDDHLKHEPYAPNAAELYSHAQALRNSSSPRPSSDSGSGGGVGGSHYAASASLPPRLPPILQVEKQQVTTTATQAASASRRRNEAHFVCPVPGCGSTFTRRFNLRGEAQYKFGHYCFLLTNFGM